MGGEDVAEPKKRGSGLCENPSSAQPTYHSPAQRQLAQALHTAGSEHVLLCARPVQYRAEAERHFGASTRRAHLERGWSKGEAPCRDGAFGEAGILD